MHVWRERDASHLGLERIELAVLASFVDQVTDRLRVDEDEDDDDPFAMWERDMGTELSTDDDERDPLLDRLFPQVFPDDARASAEHRRFSEEGLRRQKAREADVVLTELEAAQRRLVEVDDARVHEVVVRDADLDVWLRTLNATRLALAMELDITSAEDVDALESLPDDDERIYPWSVYEFLGELQGILLGLHGFE